MSVEKRVVIVRDKESVVVRGIEKKLVENGYFVFMSGSSDDEIKGNVERASFFIIYLPADILDNDKEIRRLIRLCSTVSDSKRRMVVIVETKYHDDLLTRAPILRKFPWIDRPLNMDELLKVMEAELNREDEPETAPGEAPSAEEALPAAAEPAAQPGNTKRILIVDDDPAYAKMVREWLKDVYKVDIVTTGMQAITYLVKTKADLVLLDYEMPVVDGPQVLEMLRSEPTVADIPVIFLTGIGDRESVQRVMALKPQGYVLKTTTKEDLRATLKNTFNKLG